MKFHIQTDCWRSQHDGAANSSLFIIRVFVLFAAIRVLDAPIPPWRSATGTGSVGIDLYHRLATGDGNLCLSPYSIENALAMTFAGADGKTREEMARVLHFSTNDEALHGSFGALQHQLEEMAAQSAKRRRLRRAAVTAADHHYDREPALRTKGSDFRTTFLAGQGTLRGSARAPEFRSDEPGATPVK